MDGWTIVETFKEWEGHVRCITSANHYYCLRFMALANATISLVTEFSSLFHFLSTLLLFKQSINQSNTIFSYFPFENLIEKGFLVRESSKLLRSSVFIVERSPPMEVDDDFAATGLTEIINLTRQLQRPEVAAKSSSLGGHLLQISARMDPAEHIKVSSFYEVDHSKLPPKAPDQLNSIRIVMVNEKTRMRVSLRFPSIYSLRAYFEESDCCKPDVKKLPALDEKYIIGSEVAAEALYRRIPPHELSEKRNSWRFWIAPSVATPQNVLSQLSSSKLRNVVISKKASLLSDLKGTGMITWGQRRQVRFLARHMENNCELILPNHVKGEGEESAIEVLREREDKEKQSEGDDEKEENVKTYELRNAKKKNIKGKHHQSTSAPTKTKRPKRENKKNCVVLYRQKKKNSLKSSIDRWSAERYKLAEVNMLRVMKEKHAVFGNPILRPKLRAEARKLIGDTGLLDHLLKHMAGKVAPGGEERFRRRHNAEGAMEYWLEKANLADIRKEAGVQDPYWTPPPGWKPGDNPTQDPICSREIKELKEGMAKMKKDIEELASRKHEEDLATVTTPFSFTCQNKKHNDLIPLKEMYIDLMNKKAKIDEQLMKVSHYLCSMEEEMEKLQTTMEESNRTGLTKSLESSSPRGTKRKRKEAMASMESQRGQYGTGSKALAATEDKAAKIERLKSGFRICKPQGSFLWPNMAISSPQVVVEDLISVPTPPSVSSSTSASHFHHPSCPPPQIHVPLPSSPVKPRVTRPMPSPLLETTHKHYENSGILNTTSTTTTTTTTITTTTKASSIINLNELPSNQTDNGFCGSQSHGHASTYPVTYQRRHNPTATGMPSCVSSA